MRIHSYINNSGSDLIEKYINSLTTDEQIDAYDVLTQLENGYLNTLHFKRWQGKIYEVYFYKHNRLFYVIVNNENIYLLHACRKQKNKTEKRDSSIVQKRAKESGKILHQRFL
ncbi:MAG: type II toxin-antitoxin system RelE/ParE family toxin [Eubacteriales bacterium]